MLTNFISNMYVALVHLLNHIKRLIINCYSKCTVIGGRWYAVLTEISDESINVNRYVLGFIDSNSNVLMQYFISKKELYNEMLEMISKLIKLLRIIYTMLTIIKLITDCCTDFDNLDGPYVLVL